ncbi:microfibril-associated glycoprotein 4-like isoform X1 [Argopecten irradians]|uniref:microfibril-associated glycoprotein 4-like isoform X1 n=1 Tax=Argopecten irradians TaxID=31199 RepID=UPI003722A95D
MAMFIGISLAIFVACLSGGVFIMEKRIGNLISVYEENTKAHQLSVSATEKLTEAYNQAIAASVQQSNVITTIQEQLRSISETLSEVSTNVKGGLITDCQDIQQARHIESGIYTINVANHGLISVWCDLDTDGGGWTVFQRRMDGSIDFYRKWAEYQMGFGNLDGEFWLGNQALHFLTSQGGYELRIDMEDFDGNRRFCIYKFFHVGGLSTNYKLSIAYYSGDAGNSLSRHNGRPFSTYDADHDSHKANCAAVHRGAWWYEGCHESNLNGVYLNGNNKEYADGVVWFHWRGYYYSLKSSKMMVRRIGRKRT